MKASGTKANSLYCSKLPEMNDEGINSGNITTCQTPQVLRKAMDENDGKKRLAFEVIEELGQQK